MRCQNSPWCLFGSTGRQWLQSGEGLRPARARRPARCNAGSNGPARVDVVVTRAMSGVAYAHADEADTVFAEGAHGRIAPSALAAAGRFACRHRNRWLACLDQLVLWGSEPQLRDFSATA